MTAVLTLLFVVPQVSDIQQHFVNCEWKLFELGHDDALVPNRFVFDLRVLMVARYRYLDGNQFTRVPAVVFTGLANLTLVYV